MKKTIFITNGNSLIIGRNPDGIGVAICVGELFKEPIEIQITTQDDFETLMAELSAMWEKSKEGKAV